MPEQPTDTTETAAAPASPTPTDQQHDRDQEAIAMAEQRAQRAEAIAMEANQRADYASQVAANANRQPFVDPLDRYAKDSMVMTPEESKRQLSAGIEVRARAIAAQQEQHFEQRLAQERSALEARMAIESAYAARPELNDPRNQPNFVASVAKAKAMAEYQGQNVSYSELVRRAGMVYDQDYGQTKRASVPYVENGGRPDASGNLRPAAAEETPGKSKLEEMYGRKAGSIQDFPSDWSEENLRYLRAKNKPLFDRGAVTSLEEVRATVAE